MIDIEYIKNEISKLIEYNKNKADEFGEVYTTFDLIYEHVDNIDPELFKNPESTYLDPCAGYGNYPIILVEKLMEGLKEWEPDEEKRYRHIIEKQIFMIEIQPESCEIIEKLFNPESEYKLNLLNKDFLKIKVKH
mgnify:CR=1 FL=1